jgi:hypothetical protein
MEPQDNNKTTVGKKPKKKTLRRVLTALIVLLLLLIVVAIFAVPAYVSSDSCKRMILTKANASGAGALNFADLTMSWGNGISISNLSYKDKAKGLSVAVKELSTIPRYAALLTGNLSLGKTVVDEPKVEINVEKMRQKPAPSAKLPAETKETQGAPALPVSRIDLVVKNGDVKIKGVTGTVEVSQINSSVNLRPEGEQTKFDVEANVVGPRSTSTINAKGEVKPGKNWDLSKTSGNVTIETNNLDLGSLESLLAIADVNISAKGVISANINGTMKNGMIETIAADVKGAGLEITTPRLKGDTIKTAVLAANVSAARAGDLMNVEKLSVRTDWLKADANGAAPMSMGSLEDFLKPDSKYQLNANLECDVPAIVRQLPATLGLKEGMKVTAGKLTGSVQTLTEAGTRKLSGQVAFAGIAGTYNGKPVAISEPIQAQALITAQGKKLKFEKVAVTSAFASVNCSGTTEAFSYDAQTDLARLAAELGQFADLGKYKLEGQLASKGNISNNKNTTMISGSAQIANLRVNPTPDITITEPNASLEIAAAYDKSKQTLLVKQLKADTSLGELSIKDGQIPFGEKTKEPMSLTTSARNVDLSKLQPYLVMTKTISKDVQFGGIADSDVTVTSKENNYHITTESTKIANLLVKSPGKEPFTQNPVTLSLDAEINPTTKILQVNSLDLASPNIKVKGSLKQTVEGKTSNMQGNAQLDYDWHTLSNILSAFLPGGLVMEGKRKDTITFSSRYPTSDPNQMLANLDAQAKIGFEKAQFMGLNISATNVDINVDKGILTIPPFSSTVNNGQFNFGGSADFKKKPAMFRTPGPVAIVKNVQLNDEIMNNLLGKLNPVFLGALNASGIANFDSNQLAFPITGGGSKDADITGTISLTQVKMQPTGLLGAILTATGASGGQLMTIHPTSFTVKDGFVRYTNMQMDIGNMPINFAGTVPLDPDRQIENFSVTLPVTTAGKIVKIGRETKEQVQETQRITLPVKGTPKHPELDLGKIIQEQLINTGLELLEKKVKKK